MRRRVSIAAVLREFRRARWRRDDRGIALPMVLLVFLVGVGLISAFLVAIVGSSQVTVTSRDTVRAQAAAEAGVADVLGRIADTDIPLCSLASTNIVDPSGTVPYEATVEFGTPGSFTVPSTWNTSCPTQQTLIRIVSQSDEDAFGGAQQQIERIHRLTAAPPVTMDFDDIILSEGAWTFGGNTDLAAADASRPADVMVNTGDFVCNASGTIRGSVYVKNGNATLTGSCKIEGNLEVSGNLIRTSGSGRVLGNAVVGGTVSFGGGTLPVIQGSLTHGGTLTVAYGNKSTWVGGAINQTPVTIVPPPPWRDLSLASFVAAGFEQQTWQGACNIEYSTAHPMPAVIAGLTTPTVIDATACSTLIIRTNISLNLGADVAIIAPKIHLEAFAFNSTNTSKRNLYVVSSNTSPACPSSRDDIFVAGVRFPDLRVSGLLYGHCRVEMANWGPYWQGSIYSRNFEGTPLLRFSPISDPNSTGGGGGTVVPGQLTLEVTPISVRNFSD